MGSVFTSRTTKFADVGCVSDSYRLDGVVSLSFEVWTTAQSSENSVFSDHNALHLSPHFIFTFQIFVRGRPGNSKGREG